MEALLNALAAPDWVAPAAPRLLQLFSFGPAHLALLSVLAGGSLLAAALLSDRLPRSLDAARRRPVAGWLLGMAILAILAAASVLLIASGIRHGRGLLLFALAMAATAGTACAARLLGERLAAQASPFIQLALGLLTLLLCLCSPFGLPVLALLAPLGLGALVLAGRGPTGP